LAAFEVITEAFTAPFRLVMQSLPVAGLKQTRKLRWLALPPWCQLPELFCIAERNDLQRYRQVNFGFGQE
jgi:hypothetical protein